MGLSITRLIELKTKYQRDLSHKIYTGTRLFVIFLIFAVIILSLVVLRDKGLNINIELLWHVQIILFGLSLFTLFTGNLVKEQYIEDIETKKKLPLTITSRDYYYFLSESFEKTYAELIYLRFAIKRKPYAKFSGALSDEKKLELKFLFEKVDSIFIDIKSNFEAFINSPSSTVDQTMNN